MISKEPDLFIVGARIQPRAEQSPNAKVDITQDDNIKVLDA